MNPANALGFFATGIGLWLLPHVCPGWFPSTALDGTSTRALWCEVMAVVQVGIAGSFFVQQAWRTMMSALPVGATVTEPVRGPATEPIMPIATTLAGAEPAGSITLHGDYAALWRAFHRAMRAEGQVRSLAARVVALVGTPDATFADPAVSEFVLSAFDAADPEQSGVVVPFVWSDEANRQEAGAQIA